MRSLVIVVDYFGHADTIECLESLMRMHGDFDVVVVDNSGSGSLAPLVAAWADGSSPWMPPDTPQWRSLLACRRLNDPEAPLVLTESELNATAELPPGRLVVISALVNRGFAAANNIGFRFGAKRKYDAFWLLNNDTVVCPDTLLKMEARVAEAGSFGICGATVAFYHEPDVVQCFAGANYDPVTASSVYIGYRSSVTSIPDRSSVESGLDMVVGASMFVSRAFVETVGALDESYFLYFEEMDWSLRSQQRFSLIYAPEAIVYHKHGASTGSSSGRRRIGRIALLYLHPNRLLFTKRYFPDRLARLRLNMLYSAVKLLAKLDFFAAVSLVRTAVGPVPSRPPVIPAIARRLNQ